MELHLKIIGFTLIMLSLIHVIFPAYFNWKNELSSLTLLNRQLMYVHTFFIALFVLLTGLLCLIATKDILYTPLGRQLSLGLFIFWAARLIIQFFGYSPKLWRGKWFETTVHLVFSLLWTYVSIVFFLIYRG